MFRKEINEQSPLRILEASIHGGLGKGNLGVVMARAGVGKTACLVQIALDELMRGRRVLHIALGTQSVDRVRSWYDSLFEDMADLNALDDRQKVANLVDQGRLIHVQRESLLTPEGLSQTAKLFATHLAFEPDVIVVDGFDWEGYDLAASAWITSVKGIAGKMGAELWMSACTHRGAHGVALQVPAPCANFAKALDVVLLLEPEDDHVSIRLLKDHDYSDEPHPMKLRLNCDTLRLVIADDRRHDTDISVGITLPALPPEAYTLLSGGARGTEEIFGECAERWGVGERHYTFAGRTMSRRRGVVILGAEELREGSVSRRYIEAHMHRQYPDTPEFQKVLHSIWHQVNTSGSVFVVGRLQDDGTVRGGTGWAAELAKHKHKTLHLYEIEQQSWFTWRDDAWHADGDPAIRTRRFTGTGTNDLTDDAKQTIVRLFERSFGPAPE